MDIFDDNNDHHEDPFSRNLREPEQSDLNKKIVFTSMVSLTVVLFLVFSLYLYAKCVLSRQSHRRAFIHRLTLTAHHASDAAHRRTESPPVTGLDPVLIASLPVFQSKVLEGGGGNTLMECAVCLSPLEGGEMAKLLTNCKHFFHVGCIDTWLSSNATCPLCRARVLPRLEPHDRESPTGLAGAPLILEGPLNGGGDNDNRNQSFKISDSSLRLSSFRRILSRERSSRRIQPSSHDGEHEAVDQDLERQ
ncbi:hypothetical protein RJT34_31302 [Clitoria ternatea]|uniref:RING-type E3 ubiquitin transferase n=1 Tax=Clitoria ternatea TaxID=43366 RepID=A0AAN9I183_CLITE